MTRYVLCGGEDKNSPDKKYSFFNSLSNVEKESLNVLLVYFARPSHMWNELTDEDTNSFQSIPNKTFFIKVASVENFNEELAWADIVFFKGGDGPQLTATLSQFPDLKIRLKDKVVGAISAGVNAISSFYYSRRGQKVLSGLGLLDIKVFTHFEDDLKSEVDELISHGDNLEIIKIPEGEYIIIDDDS